MTYLEQMAGAQGCKLVADTDARTDQKIFAFVVQEDTVIATLTYFNSVGGTTNAITDIGLSGKTLKQGAVITAGNGGYFTSITLTSGSVIIY